MIVATVVFGDPVFSRMADVLEYSVRVNCPSADFVRIDAEPHVHIKGIPTHCPANAHKKSFWGDIVHENPDQDIVLLDCDTLVLGELSQVFEQHEFDLAYTVRNHRIRINAGVMFVRATHASRRFFDKWNYTQQLFLSQAERPKLLSRLKKHAGLDQAALSAALENVDFPLRTLELPCEKYNSVDQTWDTFSDETLVLHIKGNLRRFTLLDEDDPGKHPAISKPMQAWRDYERAALKAKEVCNVAT